jgi:hypothetical protein
MSESPTPAYQSKRLPGWVWALILLAASGLLFYTTYRATRLSITFDEAWSRNSYATATVGDILWFRDPTANNHPGNSLMMKASMAIFGDTTFALRLPNLLAHLLYIAFSIALARRFRQAVWVLFAFLLLNFHPYLLDFFSLARGYGLAMAMVMGSLYHLFAFRENPFSRHLLWNVVFAMLAVFFNFSFLHFFLANAVVLLLLILSHARAWNGNMKTAVFMAGGRILPLVVASVALYLYMRGPVRLLVETKQLYYGGASGFWTDTVFSLAHSTLYKIDFWEHDVAVLLKVVLVLLVTMFVTFAVDLSERKYSLRESPGAIAFFLLCIPVVTTTLQHYWTDSLFLIYRTAMFLLPVFMAALVWMLRTIAKVPAFRMATIPMGITVAGAVLLINGIALNATHTAEWPFDADTRNMMKVLQDDVGAHHRDRPVSIGVSWQLRSGVNYYRRVNDAGWLNEPDNKGCPSGKDYYYVLNHGEGCMLSDSLLPFGKQGGMVLIQDFPISNTELWGVRSEK